ncbi:MAG: hypothetical protein EZS28_056150, partial [Streblomastix strix]
VTFDHINALKCFGVFGTNEQRIKLFELGVPRAIFKYLKSQDEKVSEVAAALIAKCIFGVWTTTEEDEYIYINQTPYNCRPFPCFDQLQHDGVTQAIQDDGFLNQKNGGTKQQSAEALGYIYTSRTLPEILMIQLITYLRESALSNDSDNIRGSAKALRALAHDK